MRSLLILPLWTALTFAQNLDLKALDKYSAQASETVDVTLDSSLLQLAGRFLSADDPGQAKVRKLISGLKGIYVRSFEFEKEGQYAQSDVDAIRAQLRTPGWSRIVGAFSRKNGENAEVFVQSNGKQIAGLAIIAADPKELTVVSIVGAIDPEELRQLGGNFGIPKIDIEKKAPVKKESQ